MRRMSELASATGRFATHEVTNQSPPLEGLNLFETNVPLVEALEREGGAWAVERAREAGREWGGEPLRWGFEANENPPRLRTHDRAGNRVDELDFHPSWWKLMELGRRDELHSLPWLNPRPGAHVARAALYMTATQAEAGFGCPVTMTFASVPALRAEPAVARKWESRLVSPEAGGAWCGMAMTEKQGGSDVRTNTTVATPVADGEYLLVGHKWFCSAPFCDLFLVLAQTDEGLSCFALPRLLPDGTRNRVELLRLKDKVGNRSNASSEIEFKEAWAQPVGEPGRGVRTIIEMVAHTRLDCCMGTSAQMRWAVANATWHAAHRSAFGKLLAEQPLMQNVLADLCLESEAATALTMRLARSYDERDDAFRRIATAVGKYWICKRGPRLAYEAMETLGGNGYVEDGPLGRVYREMPVNSIWEGSGNVVALDVLRAAGREPGTVEALLAEIELGAGEDRRLDAHVARLQGELVSGDDAEPRLRRLVEGLALALQASLLVRHAPAFVADAFCTSRLGDDRGHEYGTLPSGVDAAAIVARHTPWLD
jgi:putative acyl-CoA dehydrogenase